jgi:Ca2+-binding RTX toxin-like protein
MTTSYTLAKNDILDVGNGKDAITWEGAGTTVSVVINGTIASGADNGFTISKSSAPTGTLTFFVESGGSVNSEFDARDFTSGTITVANNGLFNGGADHAMRFATDGGSMILNNNETGVLTTDDASEDVIKDGANATINNKGKIVSAGDELAADGTPSKFGGDAIDFGDGTNNIVNNFAGAIIAASHHGITGDKGATITNDVGGQIIGHNGSGINFDNTDPADIVTVSNSGVIMGQSQTYADSDGDAIDCDGSVNVENHGFIGGMGANGQHDAGDNHAEAFAIGGGTVKNFADGTIFSVQRAFQVDDSAEGPAPAALTLTNAGIIQASNGWEAIKIVGVQDDKITNSGTIIGDIVTGDGNDTVTLKAGSSIKGEIQLGDGKDTLTAVEGKLNIDAGAGDDTVKGGSAADTINGSDGADMIYGRGGADKLTGGADADTFFFALGDTGTTAKTEDTIVDFSVKDKDMLNLSAFDANVDKKGNQDFTFINSADFDHKAGELRFEQVKGNTYVYGDLDGDAKADFAIHLDGSVALKAGSFDL